MSKKLSLSLAVGPYEHVRDLVSGEVPVEGIELTPMHCPIEDLLYRTHNFSEWHIAELGLGGYVARLARGEQPYVAIPVFTSRMRGARQVAINRTSGYRRCSSGTFMQA